jgi:type IV secretory pathway VirB2 component (pilin)
MKLFKVARKYGRQSAAAVAGLALSTMAMAQTATGPFDAFFDAISLDGITAKVVAAGVIIVGIALAFKGPDVAKRVVRKV